jgi:hypothetical protein
VRFIKFEEIKPGMRCAKPIYNKEGVLLYGRNTIISDSFINNTKALDIYGLYILEPAEPLPPMSDEEIEFERFQTVYSFALKKELESLVKGESFDISKIVDAIINAYGRLPKKITFIQSLRSNKDYPYKHAISTAMISAMITDKLKVDRKEQVNIVSAALLHDIGKIIAPPEILNKSGKLTEEELKVIKKSELRGYEIVKNNYTIPATIRRYIAQMYMELSNKIPELPKYEIKSKLLGTCIINVADMFDILTAMRVYKDPMSEFAAINYFLDNDDIYNEKIVLALVNSINILPPGACVELSNGEKGLVVGESAYYILRPMVLGFDSNVLYDLSQRKVYEKIKIKDIMKTMDNRFIIKDEH